MNFISRFLSCSLLMSLLLVPGIIWSHTSNEATLFPDIKSSASRYDVMLLVAIGIVPVTKSFEPDKHLSRTDLAAWGALADGLVDAGEEPDIKALADAALKKGLLNSLDGDATYMDINNVLFKGELIPASAETIPTRGEATIFIAANLTTGTANKTLLHRRGMQIGPIGEVSDVATRMNPDGGTSYIITMDSEIYPFYTHGKLANGPIDLTQWQGRIIRRSIIRNLGQSKLWVFLEAEDLDVQKNK